MVSTVKIMLGFKMKKIFKSFCLCFCIWQMELYICLIFSKAHSAKDVAPTIFSFHHHFSHHCSHGSYWFFKSAGSPTHSRNSERKQNSFIACQQRYRPVGRSAHGKQTNHWFHRDKSDRGPFHGSSPNGGGILLSPVIFCSSNWCLF